MPPFLHKLRWSAVLPDGFLATFWNWLTGFDDLNSSACDRLVFKARVRYSLNYSVLKSGIGWRSFAQRYNGYLIVKTIVVQIVPVTVAESFLAKSEQRSNVLWRYRAILNKPYLSRHKSARVFEVRFNWTFGRLFSRLHDKFLLKNFLGLLFFNCNAR